MAKSAEQWWSDAVKDRCTEHEQLMQHCLKAGIAEALSEHKRVLELAGSAMIDARNRLRGSGMFAQSEPINEALAAIAELKNNEKLG